MSLSEFQLLAISNLALNIFDCPTSLTAYSWQMQSVTQYRGQRHSRLQVSTSLQKCAQQNVSCDDDCRKSFYMAFEITGEAADVREQHMAIAVPCMDGMTASFFLSFRMFAFHHAILSGHVLLVSTWVTLHSRMNWVVECANEGQGVKGKQMNRSLR